MSLRHPSLAARRLLKIASIGLAGLLAGLLTGCNSNATSHFLAPRNDTDWQTSSTYASATSSMAPRDAMRSAHAHPCFAAPCGVHAAANHSPAPHHRTM
jgi:hypothetical protein